MIAIEIWIDIRNDALLHFIVEYKKQLHNSVHMAYARRRNVDSIHLDCI